MKKAKKTNAETANEAVAIADGPGEGSVGEAAHVQSPKNAIDVTADDLVDDEWLEGKKAKKGKAKDGGDGKSLLGA
jgi:hypothetical protein